MYKILVVDDEMNIRRVVREYAEFEGYEVDEAENGMAAIEKVKNNDYDLIVMDIMMPKMDGVETLNKLKKLDNFDVPVIALTADAMQGTRVKYIELGFDEYLSKPIDRELLKQVLNKFLN